MIRLILALGVVGALWPVGEQDSSLSMPPKRSEFEISSADVFHAAYSIYEDIGGFCERNTEVCLTGMEAINSASASIQSRFNGSDPIQTGSIVKAEESIGN